ncbi:MAG: integration host factor subunit beta [Acidobacteria bacterium]|nr:integration host factor subunit beta [Acidobacteriota bacterium]
MIKADLVRKVMDVVELPQTRANEAVNTIFDAMREALTSGERIELRGFGVFIVKNRKRGIGRNPKTGVEVAIPPGKTIRFKPGKALRVID